MRYSILTVLLRLNKLLINLICDRNRIIVFILNTFILHLNFLVHGFLYYGLGLNYF